MYPVGPELLDDPLYTAAHMRAHGVSWLAIGRELNCTPKDAERAALADHPRWKWLLKLAEKETFRELGCEAMAKLRFMMHDKDPETSHQGIALAMQFWGGLVRHRSKAKNKSDSPFE